MKRIGLFIVFTFILLNAYSQTIEDISKIICNRISKSNFENKDSSLETQLDIYAKEKAKNLFSLIDTSRKDIKYQFNVVEYKVIRELNKMCPSFKIKHSTLLALTSVVDVENIYSPTQLDSIDNAVRKLRKNKDLVLLVVTIDDLFPYKNFEEYAMNQMKNWHIGALNSKGGAIIVFSKSLREIRISTNAIAREFLSDEECSYIIQNIILPEFRKRNFSKAILNCIDEIYDKI